MRTRAGLAVVLAIAVATAVPTLVPAVTHAIRATADSPTLAIVDVAVIDVTNGAVQPRRTVLVSGSRITSIAPTSSTHVPDGVPVVQGAGKFLIPGLWDMHTHVTLFGPSSLALYLAYGVTSIRDMGAERFAEAKDLRDRVAAGLLPGPRMRIASPVVENARWLAAARRMTDQAGTPWRLHERVAPASPEEAVRIVDTFVTLGADHIKVRNWPAPEIGRALVDRARERGLRVVGHGNEPFPRRGIVSLEHGIWPPVEGTEAERAALWRDLAANGVAMVPTLVTRPVREHRPAVLRQRLDSGVLTGGQYVSAAVRQRWRDQLAQFEQETPQDWAAIQREDRRNVAEMHASGMTMLAGTDLGVAFVIPGISLHDELSQLVAIAKLTPLQALQAATIAPARVTGAEKDLGTIAPGKLADLVLLDANPLADIQRTTRIAALIANGRLFDRAALATLLAAAESAARIK
jgi:imidazolonepropionase-like amidohydrolase